MEVMNISKAAKETQLITDVFQNSAFMVQTNHWFMVSWIKLTYHLLQSLSDDNSKHGVGDRQKQKSQSAQLLTNSVLKNSLVKYKHCIQSICTDSLGQDNNTHRSDFGDIESRFWDLSVCQDYSSLLVTVMILVNHTTHSYWFELA